MHILTFIALVLATLGFMWVGAKLFALSFMYLAKVFQRVFLVVGELARKAVRSVQAVIQSRIRLQRTSARAKAQAQSEVADDVRLKEVPEHVWYMPDWSLYEEPAYLRRGKSIVF